jgi:ATP-binding cassette subfamily B protein
VTQHVARLSEALGTLLVPHDMQDHPEATPLVKQGTSVAFENVAFQYPDCRRVFSGFDLKIEPGERVGLVGQSEVASRRCSRCSSGSMTCATGEF